MSGKLVNMPSTPPLAAVVRDVAVEEADACPSAALGVRNVGGDLVVGVVRDAPAEVALGEVGDAGGRVYVHRFVREEAHLTDRGPRQLVLGVVRVNLEDETVAIG